MFYPAAEQVPCYGVSFKCLHTSLGHKALNPYSMYNLPNLVKPWQQFACICPRNKKWTAHLHHFCMEFQSLFVFLFKVSEYSWLYWKSRQKQIMVDLQGELYLAHNWRGHVGILGRVTVHGCDWSVAVVKTSHKLSKCVTNSFAFTAYCTPIPLELGLCSVYIGNTEWILEIFSNAPFGMIAWRVPGGKISAYRFNI